MIADWDEKKDFFYENGYFLTSEVYRMGNVLAHYELYKRIINLPGDVIELGVFKGSSLIQFATFRELLENEKSRKIVGFDVFGKFPLTEKMASDVKFIDEWNNKFENEFVSKQDIYNSLERKNISNVELIEGDINHTIDEYMRNNPHTRIALLHIDTDTYEPAKAGLEKLYDRVVRGGIIIFDDYATIEGETVAVDEFLADKDYTISKLPLSHGKPSYIVKK